jgi:hypothetical protein
MDIAPATLDWLLEGDPAIRWQVQRDLLDADTAVWSAERARVATEGWGAEVLRHQAEDGRWGGSRTEAGGLYTPKWTSTTYTLYLLRQLGLPPGHPQATAGCAVLLEGGLYLGREMRFSRASRGYVQEGGPEAGRDLGVTALVLAFCLYFGSSHPALGAIVAFLLTRQQSGGAWWPDSGPVAEAYATETTRLVLDALAEWRRSRPNGPTDPALTTAIQQGQNWLLDQHLGASADGKPAWRQFAYPSYWFYDVLTALDDLRAARLRPDGRMGAAVALVRKRRKGDGRWLAVKPHAGKTFLSLDTPGEPSRWNTLRALRVLRWWEA